MLTAHAGGNVLSWMRNAFHAGEDLSYDALTEAAARAQEAGRPPVLLLPHFYGSREPEHMRQAQGVLLGMSLGSNRDDLALGVLRGVALEVARSLESFRRMGTVPDEVRMIGGGARSDVWAQMVADATGVRVLRPQVSEAAALGAAVLAGVAAGVFPSVEAVVDELPARDALEPDPSRRDLYDHLLARFKEACTALGPIWARRAGA